MDQYGRSILHVGVGHIECGALQYSLYPGPDQDARDSKRDGILSYAALGGSVEIFDTA